MKDQIKGILYPALAACIWGFAFVAQVEGAAFLGKFSYNALRFGLGAISLVIVTILLEREKVTKEYMKKIAVYSVIAGTILFTASTLQQWGIALSPNAGKAGFLTGLYIVLVPLWGLLRGRGVGLHVWGAVVLAAVGAFLLCVTDGFSVALSDIVLLLCAVCFTAHILVLDVFAKRVGACKLSCGQFFVTAMLSAICIPFDGALTWEAVQGAALPVLYGGLLSVGVAYTLQVLSQKYADPTKASLLFACESVFAAIGGALFLDERMTLRSFFGCVLIFGGILLSQLPFGKKTKKTVKSVDKEIVR